MKILITYIFQLVIFQYIAAQAPEIEWQNTIGGNSADLLYSIQQTTDYGYIILGGHSSSGLSGDKTDPGYGEDDYWLVKLDSTGDISWQKTLGGNGADYLLSIQQTTDSGYILGGYSFSGISGVKNESQIGIWDYWVIKLDLYGNIQWQNTIGGTSYDFLKCIEQTADGGYIIGGYSNSGISGDKTEPAWIGGVVGFDYWLVKLDSTGSIEWQNTIGGDGDDYLNSVEQTFDGGYILGGYSNSGLSGDKSEPVIGLGSLSDYWIVKLTVSGEIEWQNTIGGDDTDELYSVHQNNDGSYIIGGFSISGISGDKTEISNNFDYWVIKLDSVGNIIWQNTIGGFSNDFLYSVSPTIDGGYILGGSSNSTTSPDKTDPEIGSLDYWVVKISEIGTIEWDNAIGGLSNDFLYSIKQTEDNGYILGGHSFSGASGDKTEETVSGGSDVDFWVIKLYPEDCLPELFYADADEDGFGNNLLSVLACNAPPGYISDNTDCNDLDAAIHPGALEICNGSDDDCNLIIDDELPVYNYFLDVDGDSFGDLFSLLTTCAETPPPGYVVDNTDCDDFEDLIHEPILYFADVDGDLYGNPLNSEFFCNIFPPAGYVNNYLDCNDENTYVNPLSNEICNDIDDNCNEDIDEGLALYTLFIDADNDFFGNAFIDTTSCLAEIAGYVSNNLDCNDSNSSIYPGAVELLNSTDDNCNNLIDEGLTAIENIHSIDFEIYPNPNDGNFKIIPENLNVQKLEIIIFNSIGEKIYSEQLDIATELNVQLEESFSGIAFILISEIPNSAKSYLPRGKFISVFK